MHGVSGKVELCVMKHDKKWKCTNVNGIPSSTCMLLHTPKTKQVPKNCWYVAIGVRA